LIHSHDFGHDLVVQKGKMPFCKPRVLDQLTCYLLANKIKVTKQLFILYIVKQIFFYGSSITLHLKYFQFNKLNIVFTLMTESWVNLCNHCSKQSA